MDLLTFLVFKMILDHCYPGQWEYNQKWWLTKKKMYWLPNETIVTSSPITKTYYNPNPGYDAYWTDGHWIFGTTTTRPTATTSTRTRPLVCRKPCGIEYRLVNEVCAHQVDYVYKKATGGMAWWPSMINTDSMKPHFTTFGTYCEFLNRQCADQIWNYMSWVFIHFGPCLDDEEVYLPVETDVQIYNRKPNYLWTYTKSMIHVRGFLLCCGFD